MSTPSFRIDLAALLTPALAMTYGNPRHSYLGTFLLFQSARSADPEFKPSRTIELGKGDVAVVAYRLMKLLTDEAVFEDYAEQANEAMGFNKLREVAGEVFTRCEGFPKEEAVSLTNDAVKSMETRFDPAKFGKLKPDRDGGFSILLSVPVTEVHLAGSMHLAAWIRPLVLRCIDRLVSAVEAQAEKINAQVSGENVTMQAFLRTLALEWIHYVLETHIDLPTAGRKTTLILVRLAPVDRYAPGELERFRLISTVAPQATLHERSRWPAALKDKQTLLTPPRDTLYNVSGGRATKVLSATAPPPPAANQGKNDQPANGQHADDDKAHDQHDVPAGVVEQRQDGAPVPSQEAKH